ncbi:hypothetical protein GCM10028803_18710 [Larkinella knui]
MEFVNILAKYDNNPFDAVRLFGGIQSIINQKTRAYSFNFSLEFNNTPPNTISVYLEYSDHEQSIRKKKTGELTPEEEKRFGELPKHLSFYQQFYKSFSRLFIKNNTLQKFNYQDNKSLSLSADNLEKVLKRIFDDETLKEEIDDWLSLFIPGFEAITIHSDTISGNDSLLLKDKHIDKPFNKSLISDGTYNIIALLTAIYQSDEPQFLCIEEPENGLNPKVVRELVNLCRYACEEKGHFIWLNTHSQTLVSKLEPKELILVDKKKGSTQVKQFTGERFYGLRMDEAWLTNALGGGLPW